MSKNTSELSVLKLHRWTGLLLGAALLVSALSGLGLAFRKQLEPVAHADLLRSSTCETMVPLDLLLANAQTAYGSSPAEYIRIYGDPQAAARIRFKDNDTLYLDRCNGQVLGEMNRYEGVFGSIEQLHTLRYWKSGSAIVASIALCFLVVLIIGGAYLVYPLLRRNPAKALRLDPRVEGHSKQLGRHRTFALWVSPLVFLSALTGLPQGFGWLEDALYTLDDKPTPPKPNSVLVGPATIPVEVVRQRLEALLPNAQEALIKIPRKPGEAYEIYAMAQDAWHANARNYIYVDAGTGQVLSFRPYKDLGIGSKIYYAAISLHTGMPAGIPGQLAMFLSAIGLIAAILAAYRSFLGRTIGAKRREVLSQRLPMLAMVLEAKDISPNTRMIRLGTADGSGLPEPSAGSHVDVHCAPGIVRQYSVVNGPGDKDYYEIAVRLSADSRGGSSYMHRLKVGEIVKISEPRNNFQLAKKAGHHLLIASGIGITPILSMARHLATTNQSWSLHYFVRSVSTAAYAAELSSEPLCAHVTIHEGLDPNLYAPAIDEIMASLEPETHVYFCGGDMLMKASKAAAAKHAWPSDFVHCEYFQAQDHSQLGPNAPFEVRLAKSGAIIQVAADQSVLEALNACGARVASSCEEGLCGTCLTNVLDGEIDHRDSVLSDAQRAEGRLMLVCVSRSRGGRLTLDL